MRHYAVYRKGELYAFATNSNAGALAYQSALDHADKEGDVVPQVLDYCPSPETCLDCKEVTQ